MGLAMGANAEHDLYFSGLRKNCDAISFYKYCIKVHFASTIVNAPWPPMLCPVMLTRAGSSCWNDEHSAFGSSSTIYVYMLYPLVQGSLVAST